MRRGIILCYHRVAFDPVDPWRLCVPPAAFAAQLRVLSSRCEVVELEQLMPSALRRRRRPLAAVTFDDGYLDNFDTAQDLLEQHGVPATVFLTTDFVTGRRTPWWDALAHALLAHPSADRSLTLPFPSGSRSFAGGTPAVHDELYGLLQPLPADERDRLVERVVAWSGLDRARLPRMASAADVSAAGGSCLSFGAHTRSHPVLARLPHAGQEAEIAESKQVVEELASRPVTAFAYPHGRAGDFTRETSKLVAAAGFSLACTTRTGVVSTRSAAYELPRLVVTDDGEDAFERALVQTLRASRSR
jgi:peptidoglycan/xylan/chitin deacetylase (PgdA/CDA1 family)